MFALPRHTNARLLELERKLEAQRHELEEAHVKISRLEEALHKACDYAEVCAHFPGRELLLEQHQIEITERPSG